MHLTLAEAERLLQATCAGLPNPNPVPVVLCVPAPYLTVAARFAKATGEVYVGGQNLSAHAQGAYTGEVSGAMLRSTGADYVIVGHSERRSLFFEDNHTVRTKVERALAEGLRPILCVGETLEERTSGHWQAVIEQQLTTAFLALPPERQRATVVAYEPVWAIGTGQTATPAQAAEVHDYIRRLAGPIGQELTILYGGSVKPDNAADLFALPTLDGALVGGASLDAEAFLAIHAALMATA